MYFIPIAYTLPHGLSSVNGSSSTGGCRPERCIMITIGSTATNDCDCPGTTPVNGSLIDGVIPSIDTTQRGTWASELFVVNRNGQDSIMIGFQFPDSDFLRRVEITYLDCPIWGAGTTTVSVYSSFVFPIFIPSASNQIGELSLIDDVVQSCTSLKTVSITTQPMSSSIFYVKFSFIGGSSVHPLNWLHLAEITFSDKEVPSIVTTTTTEYITSSIISTCHQTTTDRVINIQTTHTMDETETNLGSGFSIESDAIIPITTDSEVNIHENGTSGTIPETATMDLTLPINGHSSMEVTLPNSTTDARTTNIPVITIVGGLTGIIAILLLLLIIVAAIMAYFVVHHRRNLKFESIDLEPHYAVIENPNSSSGTPLMELEGFTSQGGEERRSSTAINNLYQPTTEIGDRNNSSIALSASGLGGDVLYSEIRDVPIVHNSRSREREAQDTTDRIDLYNDDDDNIESHYAIIPEMYTLATPINLNVKPQSAVNSIARGDQECIGELQSYTLVRKQLPPPVPEKSCELQQYLTVKVTADTEAAATVQGPSYM